MTALSIDFETRSVIDLDDANVYVLFDHPTTDVWCMAYAFDGEEVELWTPDSDEPPTRVETVTPESLEMTSRLIEKKLKDFGVEVRVVLAQPGPVITRYEIEPATGVKVMAPLTGSTTHTPWPGTTSCLPSPGAPTITTLLGTITGPPTPRSLASTGTVMIGGGLRSGRSTFTGGAGSIFGAGAVYTF